MYATSSTGDFIPVRGCSAQNQFQHPFGKAFKQDDALLVTVVGPLKHVHALGFVCVCAGVPQKDIYQQSHDYWKLNCDI